MSTKNKNTYFSLYRIVFIGVMAAVVYVVSMFRFPFLGSKVHFGNTICLLAGLLFGPISGGLSAGIGSFITDATSGYPFWEGLITFVSKFAMGLVAGLLGNKLRKRMKNTQLQVTVTVAGSILGALSYVFLYMLKHLVLQLFIYQNGWEATMGVLVSKFPASIINALFAMVCAPIIFFAMYPAIIHIPLYRKIEKIEMTTNVVAESKESNKTVE